MIDELIQAAQTEVDNHSIYVWGGSRRRSEKEEKCSQ